MVHQYRNNGYNIVLDTDSGSVHVADEIVYDVIAALKENPAAPDQEILSGLEGRWSRPELEEALDEVRTLEKEGRLFSRDAYRGAVLDFKNRPVVVKALCLHIAHDCNLACSTGLPDHPFRQPPQS